MPSAQLSGGRGHPVQHHTKLMTRQNCETDWEISRCVDTVVSFIRGAVLTQASLLSSLSLTLANSTPPKQPKPLFHGWQRLRRAAYHHLSSSPVQESTQTATKAYFFFLLFLHHSAENQKIPLKNVHKRLDELQTI